MTYYLNMPKRIIFICGGILLGVFGGLSIFSFFTPNDSINDIMILFFPSILFMLVGFELIFEGLKTKIEVYDDKIIYYQSRYIISANWCDLQAVLPFSGLTILKFSNSQKIRGGFFYKILTIVFLHTSVPINLYLSDENKNYLRDRVIEGIGIKDEKTLQSLRELF